MILFDRKKALNQIMGPTPKEGPEEPVDHAHALAKEAIEAVHAHDHEGFANATRAMFLHYNDQHEGNAGEDHSD